MTPLDLAKAYLAKGLEDEAVLKELLTNQRISDSVFGFHAQQAAEKYLKAVLAIDQARPQKSHDLRSLADQCAQAGHPLPDENEEVLELSPFAVQERYPFALTPPIDRQDTLENVSELRRWVEQVVR